MGAGVSWGEFSRLVERLMADPASWLHAELAGWEHPASREWIAAYQMHALSVQVNTKKPHRFLPAPWDPKPKKYGSAIDRGRFDALMAAQRARPVQVQTPTA